MQNLYSVRVLGNSLLVKKDINLKWGPFKQKNGDEIRTVVLDH